MISNQKDNFLYENMRNEIKKSFLMQQSHNVSLTGGSEKTQYAASLNYFTQKGVVKNNAMDRFTMKVNLDQELSKYIKTGFSLHLSRNQYDNSSLGDNDFENAGIISSALRFDPSVPVRDENGASLIVARQLKIVPFVNVRVRQLEAALRARDFGITRLIQFRRLIDGGRREDGVLPAVFHLIHRDQLVVISAGQNRVGRGGFSVVIAHHRVIVVVVIRLLHHRQQLPGQIPAVCRCGGQCHSQRQAQNQQYPQFLHILHISFCSTSQNTKEQPSKPADNIIGIHPIAVCSIRHITPACFVG